MLIVLSIFRIYQVLNTFDKELGAYAVEGVTKSITRLNTAFEQ